MTLGIAAICENGTGAVMAADRLVGTGIAGLELEMDNKKLIQLYAHAMVSVTGILSEADFTIEKFRDTSGDFANRSTIQIAERLRDVCQQVRVEQCEGMYLRRTLGIGMEEFRQLSSSASPQSALFGDIYTKINNHNFGVSFLLAGVDHNGAHLFVANDAGVVSHESLGFMAVGSGAVVAQAAFSRRQHIRARSLADTVYGLYEAKRAAEPVQGVGPATDIAVLRHGRDPQFLSEQSIATLSEIYERRRPPALAESDVTAIADTLPNSTPPAAASNRTASKTRRRRR